MALHGKDITWRGVAWREGIFEAFIPVEDIADGEN